MVSNKKIKLMMEKVLEEYRMQNSIFTKKQFFKMSMICSTYIGNKQIEQEKYKASLEELEETDPKNKEKFFAISDMIERIEMSIEQAEEIKEICIKGWRTY